MTAPANAVDIWLAQRRAWRPTRLPETPTEAGRRFRCDDIRAEIDGRTCALRRLRHAERDLPTSCADCAAGARRVELLQISLEGHHNNRHDVLDDRYLSQIGKMPDDVLALRAGVRACTIQRARCDLGLKAYSGPRCTPRGYFNWPVQDWTDSIHLVARRLWCTVYRATAGRREIGVEQSRWDAAQLGEQPDGIVAARLGLDEKAVARYRRSCGLDAAPQRSSRRSIRVFIEWDSQPLGELTDDDLARRLWVPRQSVRNARAARGIKAKYVRKGSPRCNVDWSVQPLGEVTDGEVARRLGVNIGTVAHHRRRLGIAPFIVRRVLDEIDWDAQPLGREPDTVIAERLGVCAPSVAKARGERGVSAWTPAKHIDWDDQPLGLIADKDLAEALGVHANTVSLARRERHIPMAPPVRRIDVLRDRGQLGARLADWADAQKNALLAGQYMLRALNGDFGTLDDIVEALGERFTVVGLSRHVRRLGCDAVGVHHLIRLEVIRGRLVEGGTTRGRVYEMADAEPRPALDPTSATVDDVFAHTGAEHLDNGLLRHLFEWDGAQAKRWLTAQVADGHLVKHGRCGGTSYARPQTGQEQR